MSVNDKDSRGYTGIHRAFENGTWQDIEEAVEQGAELDVITPGGASLKDFAAGLRKDELYRRLVHPHTLCGMPCACAQGSGSSLPPHQNLVWGACRRV